jgi:polyisoprenoid-binding protein YceI
MFKRTVLMGAFVVGGFFAPAMAAESFKVDPVHSNVIFRIKHLDVSFFYARFKEITGTFNFDEPTGIAIEVKPESVDTKSEKLDTHLKSADFFNVKEFPTISFKSTAIKPVADKEGTYEVTGDLTLHGVTKPLTVTLEKSGMGADPWGGQRCGFEVLFTIKRSDFGMNFMLDKLGDEVRLTVSVEGSKKQAQP